MGILSWWRGKEAPAAKTKPSNDPRPEKPTQKQELQGMNGAVEVPRPADVTVFEFGSAAASADKITLAGYCSVSEDLEPCRWEILSATSTNDPQFRRFPTGIFFLSRVTIQSSYEIANSFLENTEKCGSCYKGLTGLSSIELETDNMTIKDQIINPLFLHRKITMEGRKIRCL